MNMEFLKKVYHAVAAVLLMLVTSLIYGGYILEWRGKRPLCILIAAMAVTAVLIALVCRYLKKYAGQIAVVCIVPMTFCLATGLYKLYMVAADSRSIFYLAMIFFCCGLFYHRISVKSVYGKCFAAKIYDNFSIRISGC